MARPVRRFGATTMARPVRRFGLATLILALVANATACGSGGATPNARITLQMFGDAAEINAYRTLIEAFEKTVPGVEVQLVSIPSQGDHMAKLATAFAGATPPDLFLINYRRFGQFAAKDVLEDMGVLLARSARISERDFYEPALDAFRFGGRLACLAQNISSLVVYYNVGLFKRFNVPAPKPGWTWEDLLATAKALTRDTNDDKKTDIYGLSTEPNMIRIAPFVWQNGGEVVDDTERPTKTVLLDPEEIDAMRFFINLRRVHKVVPGLEEARSEDEEARFANGRLGMLLDSRRATPALRAVPGLEWDVAPLPQGKTRATILHSDAFCMAKASKNAQAAFRFVEFAVGSEGAGILTRTGRTVPSLKAVAESPSFLDPAQKPASSKVFLDQIPFIRRVPNIATWNEIETKADPIIEEWYYGLERIEALGIEIDLATRELFAGTP